MPESSDNTMPGKISEAATALMEAFSAKVVPVSSGEMTSGWALRSVTSHALPRMARISAVLCEFLVAMRSWRMGCPQINADLADLGNQEGVRFVFQRPRPLNL